MKSTIFSTALFLIIGVFYSGNLSAQWSSNATSIWNTTLTKNVGIGTSAPVNAKLQFGNTLGNKITLFQSTGGAGYGFGINDNNLNAYIPSGASFSVRTNAYNGLEKFAVGSDGTVVVGGSDLVLGKYDGRPQKSKLSNRALVHGPTNDALVLNFGGDFEDGTVVEGPSLGVAGIFNVGYTDTNDGTYDIRFGGPTTGEGIGSKRTAGGNQSGLDFYTSYTNRMSITNGGNVGIGKNLPSYKLDVNGSVRAISFLTSSDRRYKTNIKTLDGAMNKIMAMRGTSYDFAAGQVPEELAADKQVGFIAQEMQTVMPELVKADENGMLAVNYIGVIPVLVEALKEQYEVIAEKETRIATLEAQNNDLKDRLARIEAALGIAAAERREEPATVSVIVSPNPTSGLVTVSLSNTSAAKSVNVRILDSTGHEVAGRSANGVSSVQFDLSPFPAGVYFTQVVIDGKVVNANKMQLVK